MLVGGADEGVAVPKGWDQMSAMDKAVAVFESLFPPPPPPSLFGVVGKRKQSLAAAAHHPALLACTLSATLSAILSAILFGVLSLDSPRKD